MHDHNQQHNNTTTSQNHNMIQISTFTKGSTLKLTSRHNRSALESLSRLLSQMPFKTIIIILLWITISKHHSRLSLQSLSRLLTHKNILFKRKKLSVTKGKVILLPQLTTLLKKIHKSPKHS